MAREAIFIGYRRDDTADVAGRIYDALAQRFGRPRVFKDVDNIGPGVDFGEYIKTVLPRCSVALVLIGPHWLDVKDEGGRRRIDDEHDWVRVEIETALATPDLLVVPVLVNGARLPRTEDVPASLLPLLRRNAANIRRDPDFHDDVERLATALRARINTGVLDLSKVSETRARSPSQKGRSGPPLPGLVVAAILLLFAGFLFWQFSSQRLSTEPSSVALEQPESAAPSIAVAAPISAPPVSAAPAVTAAPTERRPIPQTREFNIYFDLDSTGLNADAHAAIVAAATFAMDSGAKNMRVIGYDETFDDAAAALRRAEQRAKEVVSALNAACKRCGSKVISYRGEQAPPVATGDGVREPLNRKVTITVSP